MPNVTQAPPRRVRRSQGRPRNEKGGKFYVRTGMHSDWGPPGCQCDDCYKSKQFCVGSRVYHRNGSAAVVEAVKDDGTFVLKVSGQKEPLLAGLDDLLGKDHVYYSGRVKVGDAARAGQQLTEMPPDDIVDSKCDLAARFNNNKRNKFERVTEHNSPRVEYPLEKMSLAQLLGVAEERGIDVKNLSKKDEVLKALRG